MNYPPAKEAIIDEIIERSFREKNTGRVQRMTVLPDTRSRLLMVFGELIAGVGKSRDFFDKYIVYRMQKMLLFRVEENGKGGFHLVADKIIAIGQAHGEIRTDIPRFSIDDLLEFSFLETVKQFYLNPDRFSPRAAVELCAASRVIFY